MSATRKTPRQLARSIASRALSLLALIASSLPAGAVQAPLRLDFGGTTKPGSTWETVDELKTPSPTKPYGWAATSVPASIFDDASTGSSMLDTRSIYPSELLQDGVTFNGSRTFVFTDLSPNTDYLVECFVGRVGTATNSDPTLDMVISNGVGSPYLSNIDARQASIKGGYFEATGSYRHLYIVINSGDYQGSGNGRIYLTLNAATPLSTFNLLGLVIRDHEQLPFSITWGSNNKTLTSNTGNNSFLPASALDLLFDRLSSGDFNSLNLALDSVNQSSLSASQLLDLAWAWSWLEGWPKNTPGVTDDILIAKIDSILASPSLAPLVDSAKFAILQDHLLNYKMGTAMLRYRAYSKQALGNPTDPAPYPGKSNTLEEPTDIVLNLNSGATLLSQISGDTLAPTDSPYLLSSPFEAKAVFLRAESMFGMNSKLKTEGQAAGEDHRSYLEHMGSLVDQLRDEVLFVPLTSPKPIFRSGSTLVAFCYFLDKCGDIFAPIIGNPDNMQLPWDPADVPTFINPGPWWRGTTIVQPASAFPPEPYGAGGPMLANPVDKMREYRTLFTALGAWWTSPDIVKNGELGGGAGDDVEVVALVAPSITFNTGNSAAQDTLSVVLEKVLFNPADVDQQKGYFKDSNSQPSDVEHAAEFTSYPLGLLLSLNPGAPKYLEFCMRLGENMNKSLAPWTHTVPSEWTFATSQAGSSLESRYFYDFRFGSSKNHNSAKNLNFDTQGNIKALTPVRSLLTHVSVGPQSDALIKYALGWARAGLFSIPAPIGESPRKPIGFLPRVISQIYLNPRAVKLGGYQIFPAAASAASTGDWQWTPPNSNHPYVNSGINPRSYYDFFVEMSRITSDTASQDELLSTVAHLIDYIHSAEVSPPATGGSLMNPDNLESLFYDSIVKISGDLARSSKPALLNNSHVLSLFPNIEASSNALIESKGGPHSKYLGYSSTPAVAAKHRGALLATFEDSTIWLRNFWPFATTGVYYTDRIKMGPAFESINGVRSVHGVQLLTTLPSGSPTYGLNTGSPVSWTFKASSQNEVLDAEIITSEVLPIPTTSSPPADEVILRSHIWVYATPTPNSDLSMSLLPSLIPADYRIYVGKDTDNDDLMDLSIQSSPLIHFDGRTTEFLVTDLVTSPLINGLEAGNKYVVEVRHQGPLSVVPSIPLDLGIDSEDIFNDNGVIRINIHNVGPIDYVPSSGDSIDVYDLDVNPTTPISSTPISAIPSPLISGQAQAMTVLTSAPYIAGHTVRCVITISGTEVTTHNNTVEKVL